MPPQSSTPQRPNLDFIMNPGQPSKKPLLPSGNSTLQRALVVVVGLVLLIIAFVVVSNLLSSGQKEQDTLLLKAAQEQTELKRVADLGVSDTSSQAAKNFAVNASLTLSSDQKVYLSTLSVHGIKFKEKELGLLQSQKTDQALDAAKAAANYDDTFTQTLTQQLNTYQATLKQAYNHSHSQAIRDNLDEDFTHAGLLLQQAAQANS